MSRTNAHGRPAQVDSPWMLKKISFIRSRCSVIAGNLPARGSLRLFEDQTVPHEHGSVDPMRDLQNVETELILSDLVVVEKRLERLDKDRKKVKNPEFDREAELLEKCKVSLEQDTPLRQLTLSGDEEKRIRENPVARTTDLLQKVFGAATK